MRPRKGCEPCRERHIKCERNETVDTCRQCFDNGRTCYQATRYHFRPVTSIKIQTDGDKSVKQNLTYTPSQKWVELPSNIRFAELYTCDTIINAEEISNDVESMQTANNAEAIVEDTASLLVIQSPQFAIPATIHSSPIQLTSPQGPSFQPHQSNFLENVVNSPIQSRSVTTSHIADSLFSPPELLNPPSIASFKPSWPFESHYEAQLFTHYVKVIAPWIDTCDPHSHFEREITRRVPYHSILANSILALASRRICLLSGMPDTQSSHYADKCVTILMEALNDPNAHWDENLLATVVLLRLHEELTHDDDLCCHLFGARKILDSISAFASDGGLREAAAWISLRQHIYVSLTQQQPLGITLDNFTHSSVFDDTNNTNEAWANRIIFVFATILDVAFSLNESGPTVEVWQNLRRQIENWYESKPWDFAPLWQDLSPANVSTPGSVATTTPKDGISNSSKVKPWPELVMCHRSQVTGMQYYHMSRVVLAVYDPELARVGFATHRLKKASERIVIDAIRNIVGLANSNPDCLNAMFEASHILVTCFSYLHEEAEQNAAIAFLKKVQRKAGWSTGKMIAELEAVRVETAI